MTVDIEIRHASQPPEGWKSWAEGGADNDVVIQIHYGRLMRTGILNHKVRMPVAVKVSYLRPGCQCRRGSGCRRRRRCWRRRRCGAWRRHRAGRAVELNPIKIRGPATNDRIVELKRVAAGVQSDCYLY